MSAEAKTVKNPFSAEIKGQRKNTFSAKIKRDHKKAREKYLFPPKQKMLFL